MKWCFLIFCFACLACHDNDFEDCGVDNPEELAWFREKTELLNQSEMSEYFYFEQAEYKGQRVYIELNCCPFCNSITVVYDCAGNQVGWLGTGEGAIKVDDVKNASVVWKSNDNVCIL